MTAAAWDQLTAALAVPYQAQLEAGGHPQAMTLGEKTLVGAGMGLRVSPLRHPGQR